MRLVVLVAGVVVLAGCSADADREPASAPSKSPPGACERIASSLGWVEPLLVPRGREGDQELSDVVRGRIAYVAGAVVELRGRIPVELREPAEALRADADLLASAATPRAEAVAALRRFRESGAAIVKTCAPASTRPRN